MVLKEPAEIRGAYADTRTAEDYVDRRFTSAWGSLLHQVQVRVVNDTIRTYGVKRVLEIAPGPARLSREVSGFERGYLCEFNDSMLQVAKRRLAGAASRWTMVRGDAFALPFTAAAKLDLVYSFRFIRHFETAVRASLYRQIHSVLRDGGLFVFDAVNLKIRRQQNETLPIFDATYELDELKQELVQHGFTPLSSTDVIRHMSWQQRIQILVGPRHDPLARWMIRSLERVPGEPLEWVMVCSKTPSS